MEIIMFSVVLVFAVSLYASMQTAAGPRKNVILNVTLPREVQTNPEVQNLAGKFKKANLLVFLGSLAVALPLLFIPLPSLHIIFLTVWVAGIILISSRVMAAYSRQLSALKRQNQWFVGSTHTVTIDMEVSRAKAKMPVSKLWFLPSLAVTGSLLAAGLVNKSISIFPGLAALPSILIFLYLYTLSARDSARAWCQETEINLACSRVSIRLWTLCWTVLAGVHSLSMAGLGLYLTRLDTGLFLTAIGLDVFLTLAAIILTSSRIRHTQNILLEGARGPIYVDDDYFWQGGFYNNPSDSRTLVEKRIGYGYTINVATPKGKLAYYSLVIGLPLLLLAVFLPLMSFDTANYELTIADSQVVIEAPFYGYDFPLSDIKSVTSIETLPKGTRTNGAATSQYSLGNFNLQGYGRSKMYVYKNHPPYIVMELPDLYVFFNAKDPEHTQEMYELLLEKVSNNQ